MARPGEPRRRLLRHDGRSNPDKFDGHRDALIAFGRTVPALAALWDLTGKARFAQAAMRHLTAWFVDPKTRMNANLNHAQAIIGVNSGRAIGVIDTLQIVEVARAAALFAKKMHRLWNNPRGRRGLVRRLSGLAHHLALRHHRTRREKQSRHLLAVASSILRGLARPHRHHR